MAAWPRPSIHCCDSLRHQAPFLFGKTNPVFDQARATRGQADHAWRASQTKPCARMVLRIFQCCESICGWATRHHTVCSENASSNQIQSRIDCHSRPSLHVHWSINALSDCLLSQQEARAGLTDFSSMEKHTKAGYAWQGTTASE